MLHKIKSVTPLPGYVLLVHFSDGVAKRYDVGARFDCVPAFRDFQTIPGLFETVRVDPGGYGVSWNDDLDLACDELWANGITVPDVEQKFAEINARPPEELTPEEAASLAAAEAMDDGTTVSLEDFKRSL